MVPRLVDHSLWWIGQCSLREFPARDALPHGLCVHIVDGDLLLLLGLFVRLALADQALWERVLVDVVLVVQFRHGEATCSLS